MRLRLSNLLSDLSYYQIRQMVDTAFAPGAGVISINLLGGRGSVTGDCPNMAHSSLRDITGLDPLNERERCLK